MTAEAAARTSSRLWTKHADHVHRRTGRAIWDAAEGLPDPLTAIAAARRTAEDLLDRLARAAPEGEHLLTALARADDGYGGRPDGEEAGLAADLALSRRGPRCLTDRAGAGAGFAGLLLLGALTGEPVGLVLRSCRDPCHALAGHESTVRGWLLREGHAEPLSRGAIRTVAGGRVPHPALPGHPEEGTRYEKAYSLYVAGNEA
ncbi:hypothetical protein GCM10009839_89930 [Catenulispora yoronensis]|uniref:Uncharacterized protein n=1 Tax=Catenulispora yoronensis TaxID=450799 RepID=A0ABP5HAP7_9ACTN